MKRIFIFIALGVLLVGFALPGRAADNSLDARSMEILEASRNGTLQQMIEKYEALVKESPNDASLHYLLGAAYLYDDSEKENATFDRAFDELTKARELDPKLKYVNNSIGYIYWARGDYDKAIEYYKAETAIDPGSAAPYFNLGMAYESLKQWDKAKSQYIMAIDKDPKVARLYNNLGAIYMDWDGDYFKALDNFTKAVQLKPNVRLYRENYNNAVRKLKQLKDSLDKGETRLPPETVEKLRKMDLKEIEVGTSGT
jgi:tetratricopeptide (TPR) repeat protein